MDDGAWGRGEFMGMKWFYFVVVYGVFLYNLLSYYVLLSGWVVVGVWREMGRGFLGCGCFGLVCFFVYGPLLF